MSILNNEDSCGCIQEIKEIINGYKWKLNLDFPDHKKYMICKEALKDIEEAIAEMEYKDGRI